MAEIQQPTVKPGSGKIRLGLLSSDLRAHVVAFFAFPLFEHIDRERFEVFAYSFNPGASDAIQERIKSQVDGFRLWPDVTARDAAQMIAEDHLDILIELGGHTDLNKPEVLAYRPAPIQASWLGYPHSIGLTAVDHFICDPHNQPSDPDLMLERPLLMPDSWIAISSALIVRYPPVKDVLASDIKGYVTYGTANNPKKYTRANLTAWAQVVAATPGSHFAFVRPEAASAVFQHNVVRLFEENGVSADRIDWYGVRKTHMALYSEIDITLDTFPLTGGTTTVDALMMGVPVVSLAGEAFHERISHSILTNAGVSDLSASTLEVFHATALRLAGDRDRRQALRQNLRTDLLASALGQTETFARDFYDMIHRVVTAKAGPRTGG
jgi:predicted O-linked N-acetylglucosamine transferase (SPINDLY family)